jgi:hypothetical protein
MIPDGEYTAVVDRLEETLAVLEVSSEDKLYEVVVDEETLPADGRHSDAVLEITVRDGDVVAVVHDAEATDERQERAQDRFDNLSKRPPHSDEGGNE